MFPPGPLNGYRGRDAEWHTGISLWTQDYPRADRHFSQAVRRLTRIHTRSVEQPVNLEEGDAYDWPWLYAVQVGEWGLTDAQGKLLREYCLRGGFFMADDFHGLDEWSEFESRIRKAFPEYPIRDIEDTDPIFHTVYDITDRYQIPGQAHLYNGYKGGADGRGRALARHLRRKRPRDGGDLLQLRCRRRVGICRRPALSREIRRSGDPAGCELHHLLDDALIAMHIFVAQPA